jgi:hypothetical protein
VRSFIVTDGFDGMSKLVPAGDEVRKERLTLVAEAGATLAIGCWQVTDWSKDNAQSMSAVKDKRPQYREWQRSCCAGKTSFKADDLDMDACTC